MVSQRTVAGAAFVALAVALAAYLASTFAALPGGGVPRVIDAGRTSAVPGGRPSGLPPIPAPERVRLASSARDPLVNGQFVALIEQTLARSGSSDRTEAMREARALLLKELPQHLHASALDLLRRYVDYSEESMSLPVADIGNLNALRNMLALREVMRAKFFTADEVEGLFGDQTRHDQFFVRKLEIQQKADLTPEQRRVAIESAEQTLLSDEQRAARKESVSHLTASAQTEAMIAQALGDDARFVERAQSYGPEAAARLAQLDAETQRWNARMDEYARADGGTREKLRQTLFTAEESLRLDAAIELRRQRNGVSH